MAAKRSTTRKSAARKSAAARTRKRPAARRGTRPAPPARTPAAGSVDLAGGMRALLASIEAEVRAVSALSERIDQLVTDLNNQRAEQAKRLLTLDALRSSVNDAGLTTFLDKAIRPRKAHVPEVVPKRLSQ
ncbi:MAG: hypothetical protein ACJ735_03465 [Actinomycetes bacterium]